MKSIIIPLRLYYALFALIPHLDAHTCYLFFYLGFFQPNFWFVKNAPEKDLYVTPVVIYKMLELQIAFDSLVEM